MIDNATSHGRSGYIRRKCRCTVCIAAQNDYQKRYHAMRRAEAAAGGRPFDEKTPRRAEPIVAYIEPGDWVDRAACAGTTTCDVPQGFRGKHHRWPGLPAARALCAACPVLGQCTAWILAHLRDPCNEHIVAGMTAQERNTERRRRGMRLPGSGAQKASA